jgi:hypothetical protein
MEYSLGYALSNPDSNQGPEEAMGVVYHWWKQQLLRTHDKQEYRRVLADVCLQQVRDCMALKPMMEDLLIRDKDLETHRNTLQEETAPQEREVTAVDRTMLAPEETPAPAPGRQETNDARAIYRWDIGKRRWKEICALPCVKGSLAAIYSHTGCAQLLVATRVGPETVSLRLYDTPLTSKTVPTEFLFGGEGEIWSCSINSTGELVAVAHGDLVQIAQCRTWRLRGGDQARTIAFSQTDPNLLCIGTLFGILWLIDVSNGAIVYHNYLPNVTPVLGIDHRDDTIIANGIYDLFVCDLSTQVARLLIEPRIISATLGANSVVVVQSTGDTVVVEGFSLPGLLLRSQCTVPLKAELGLPYRAILVLGEQTGVVVTHPNGRLLAISKI